MSMDQNSSRRIMSRSSNGREAPRQKRISFNEAANEVIMPRASSMPQPRQKRVSFNESANEVIMPRASSMRLPQPRQIDEVFPSKYQRSKSSRQKFQGIFGKVMRFFSGSKKHRGGGGNGRVRNDRAIEIKDDQCRENSHDDEINETNTITRRRREDSIPRGDDSDEDDHEETSPRQRPPVEINETTRNEDDGDEGDNEERNPRQRVVELEEEVIEEQPRDPYRSAPTWYGGDPPSPPKSCAPLSCDNFSPQDACDAIFGPDIAWSRHYNLLLANTHNP